ncbi:alpha/beta fold hydrolase [Microbacterium sp. RD1]|uniref:alpha/beta fold hydrolase n=1 Tax=Microbacterium sp. RD1 TaxID=3457313 RepID=UPI003FA5F19E
MSDNNPIPITLLDGAMSGFAQLPDSPNDLPLVVFLHGGAFNALSTMIPGRSQLGLAVEHRYPAFALNRPGYMESAPLNFDGISDAGYFAASAERLDDALRELWDRYGDGRPGIILHGCSIGGAVTLTLAARWSDSLRAGTATWPLLGVAVVDVGHVAPSYVAAAWDSLPAGEFITADPDKMLSALPSSPPAWTLPPSGGPSLPPLRVPRNELLEIAGGWTRDWESTAARITVPVHYRISEYDVLWDVTPEIVDEMARALETASPYVDAAIVLGASHPVHVGPVGLSYNFEMMSFFEFLRAASSTPQLLTERRDLVE